MIRFSGWTAVACLAALLGVGTLATSAQAEWNIDLYAGPTWDDDNTESGELTVGGRVGYFFPLVGGLDAGLFADSSGVIDDDQDKTPRDFTFVPTSALGMFRYRILESGGLGLHPYVGVGPSAVWSKLEVGGADEDELDLGLDARAGLRAVIYDRFAVFSEYRLNYFEPSFALESAPDVHVPNVWHAALFGVGYRVVPAPPPPPAPVVVAEAPPEPEPAPLPAPTKKRIVLRGVTFDFNSADLGADAASILDAAVASLEEAPEAEVVVAGHSDSVGSDAYNQQLSERRASSVRDYLVDHGIAAERLEVKGFGESQPVADNSTAEGRAENRRVELNVVE